MIHYTRDEHRPVPRAGSEGYTQISVFICVRRTIKFFLRFVGCVYLWLTACTNREAIPTVFLPPTGAPQASPVSLALAGTQTSQAVASNPTELPPPTPTPPCIPGLVYLEDLTIPDGTEVSPGEILDKRWRVQNAGTCNWDQAYGVQLIGGPDLGAPPEQALFPARSGTEAILHMLFTAPEEPGVYSSAWQAKDPNGNLFGDPFFIEVVVLEKSPTAEGGG